MGEITLFFVIMAGMATAFFVAYIVTLTYQVARLAIWETTRLSKRVYYKIKEII